jgi:ADP-heptose:LPS heptosyltransferase
LAVRRRLLVLRNLGLGDFLTGIPALRGLRRAFPDHELVLVAPESLNELAALSGAVDRVVSSLPVGPTDVAVNLHGSGPESHRVVLATRPARLIAFEHRDVQESRGSPRWRADEHEVTRWCRLLRESAIPADPADLRMDVEAIGIADATVVHPGAASGSRRWPAERFAAVARAEREAGRVVVVTGGPAEVALARTVAECAGLPDSAMLAGRTSLVELAGVVAAAGRVVCGDTGVAHLATAVCTPSVVLFGPISPHEWGPPRDPKHRALWAGLTGDPHADDVHAGLLAIAVGDVLAELSRLEAAA